MFICCSVLIIANRLFWHLLPERSQSRHTAVKHTPENSWRYVKWRESSLWFYHALFVCQSSAAFRGSLHHGLILLKARQLTWQMTVWWLGTLFFFKSTCHVLSKNMNCFYNDTMDDFCSCHWLLVINSDGKERGFDALSHQVFRVPIIVIPEGIDTMIYFISFAYKTNFCLHSSSSFPWKWSFGLLVVWRILTFLWKKPNENNLQFADMAYVGAVASLQ